MIDTYFILMPISCCFSSSCVGSPVDRCRRRETGENKNHFFLFVFLRTYRYENRPHAKRAGKEKLIGTSHKLMIATSLDILHQITLHRNSQESGIQSSSRTERAEIPPMSVAAKSLFFIHFISYFLAVRRGLFFIFIAKKPSSYR